MGYSNGIMHMHNLYEIMFIISDSGSCFVNDRIYEINKFNVFLFGDTDLHKVSVAEDRDYERYILFFSPNILHTVFKEDVDLLRGYEIAKRNREHQISFTQEQGLEFLSLLEKLEVSSKKNNQTRMESILLLAEILSYVNDNIMKEFENKRYLKVYQHKQITKVIEYVNIHYTEDVGLQSISTIFFINKSYLCRLFKKETGFQLSEYITYRRMTYAIELLRKGLSIVAVAELCGFHSDTYFITIFKKNFGITPKKYTKLIGEERR